MELARVQFLVAALWVVVIAILAPAIGAQSPAPAPASEGTYVSLSANILLQGYELEVGGGGDLGKLWVLHAGVAIDQGIAYVLMLAALVLTYLIHQIKTGDEGNNERGMKGMIKYEQHRLYALFFPQICIAKTPNCIIRDFAFRQI